MYMKGACELLEGQVDEQYLRCVETYNFGKEGTFHIAVCMFKAMSELLVSAKCFCIIGRILPIAIVVAQAFITSQSAYAHYKLFKHIFSIVKIDTGRSVHFRHIHGDGIDTFTADGHRGQAKDISKEMNGYCSIQWDKPLYTLTPSEHLAHCYRYCLVHYNCNISNLRGHVDENILSAMMSLYSAHLLLNLQETLTLIRSGGKKAIDKEAFGNFAFAAIYQPMSKIPLEIWKAAPPTSNGNEQAHRNINRDGMKLTMLARIMRGLQFDSRLLNAIDIWKDEETLQQKIVSIKDKEMKTLRNKAKNLEGQVVASAIVVKCTLESFKNAESSIKKLRKNDQKLRETHQQLKKITPQCSGAVSVTDLTPPDQLFDHQLLENQPKINRVGMVQIPHLPFPRQFKMATNSPGTNLLDYT
ncbi:hypothetical protein Clacol_006800 [Clathrus columnatus]|uniref:Uncharacterized protein n=1 Tax=Clathrus columnatus TaxID=1419009 RepID=A0AAV5AD30_9AGAM|nr:hypothetical protein Clacol_006800 [Clathrus columnatus]